MNTTAEKTLYDIIDGPNRDMLFDACKYAFSDTAKVEIRFAVAKGYTKPKSHPAAAFLPVRTKDVVITQIQHEDGSGESFNLVGFCKTDVERELEFKPCNFEAYYNTKTRNGKISFF